MKRWDSWGKNSERMENIGTHQLHPEVPQLHLGILTLLHDVAFQAIHLPLSMESAPSGLHV